MWTCLPAISFCAGWAGLPGVQVVDTGVGQRLVLGRGGVTRGDTSFCQCAELLPVCRLLCVEGMGVGEGEWRSSSPSPYLVSGDHPSLPPGVTGLFGIFPGPPG